MALFARSPYLQTNDDVIAIQGDTVIVRRPHLATTTTAAALFIGGLVATYDDRRPRVTPKRGPVPKFSGALRNQRCPKCGQKFKVCGHAPAAGPTPGRAG